jgi:TPR repeat protein
MGIGCRRDPLEANVWYVKAAAAGDERAKHRIAAINAAASGANINDATPKQRVRRVQQQNASTSQVQLSSPVKVTGGPGGGLGKEDKEKECVVM